MNLVGRTIAQYRIDDEVGKGGMGVVYRAWDTRLQRNVALKFLPDSVASDPGALDRLQREARAASALNHPNICTVYDLGQDGDLHFIAMELIEGRTIEQRLETGKIKIPEILDWTIQIADALEVAHARGIVHRDLKPSNIVVTDRGLIKILDFGLAKVSHHAEVVATSKTMSVVQALTQPGTTVGTIGYMSPEQARGADIDARSDLFSVGAVLYEMITGRRAFTGDTSALVFDAILHREPVPPTRLNPDCPVALELVVSKALEKDRDVRYQSASELKVDVKRIKRDSESGHLVEIPKRSSRKPLIVAAIFLLLLVVAGAAAYFLYPTKSGPVSPGEWTALTHFSDSAVQPTISRDGRMLAFIRGADVFISRGQIYVKVLPDGDPVALTNDQTEKLGPAFSPDGSQVTYGTCCQTWDTWSVSVLGGKDQTPRRIFANATGLSWIDSDHILFSEIKGAGVHMGLMTAEKDRSNARDIFLPPHERAMIHFSAISPDHKWVLAVEMGGDGNFMPCQLLSFDGSTKPRQVGPNSSCLTVTWSPDGKWMYFSAESGDWYHIWRQRFPDGKPEQVTSGPTQEIGVAFAPDGKSFVTSVGATDSTVWIHDDSGERQVSAEQQAFGPQFSPDGSKVYYLVHRNDLKKSIDELWSSDLNGHSQAALPGININSAFGNGFSIAPDGLNVVYESSTVHKDGKTRTRLGVARLDGRSSPREFEAAEDESEPTVANDGIIYFRGTESGKNYLYRMRLDGTGRERVAPDSIIELFDVSRDGAWAAVMVGVKSEKETGVAKLVSLKDPAIPPIQICGYCAPRWSWDGKSIITFFRDSRRFYEVPLAGLIKMSKPGVDIDISKVPGARQLNQSDTSPSFSPNGKVYAFTKSNVRRNLYSIPVR